MVASLDSRQVPEALPDADVPPGEEPTATAHPLARIAFVIGAAGLVVATATDALAVLGRHTGFSLLGSIEIVQCSVILAASAAMIGATVQGAHASVHIFTERMQPAAAARLARVAALLGALLFASTAVGSAWVASDLWGAYERSELLGIPLRGFRLVWIGAALVVTGTFLRAAFRGGRQ